LKNCFYSVVISVAVYQIIVCVMLKILHCLHKDNF
jgi:hypothetical protein